jgi:hypothetical protein
LLRRCAGWSWSRVSRNPRRRTANHRSCR